MSSPIKPSPLTKGFAKRGLGQADPLQTDGSEHHEGGSFIRHRIGDGGAEVLRNRYQLGMGAIGSHPIPNSESMHVVCNGYHSAHVAIAQRKWLIQLAAYRVESWQQPIGSHLLQHLLNLVGLLASLVQPAGFTKSTNIRSVPADTREQEARINSSPRRSWGLANRQRWSRQC